jgi:hypothetical protein
MGDKQKYSDEFNRLVASITNKRAKIVIEHILKHDFITTEDIENYGYKHAPRAARDVRESGIPLTTYNVKSNIGKSIAAYKFGDLTQLQANKSKGRIQFSKEFKLVLYKLYNGKCSIRSTPYEERYLQIDHRVPYEVGGDAGVNRKEADYLLLCGSCNRTKSWSCEHCLNWKEIKDCPVCLKCYWGNPENHTHIALEEMRRVDLTWIGKEVKYYDLLKKLAEKQGIKTPKFIKDLIERLS